MGNITHFQSNHKKLQTGESWRSAEVGLHYSHFHQAEITQSAPGMSLNGFKPGPAEACWFLKSRLTVLCLGSEEPKTPNKQQFRQKCGCSAKSQAWDIGVQSCFYLHLSKGYLTASLRFLICSYRQEADLTHTGGPWSSISCTYRIVCDSAVPGIIKRTYTITGTPNSMRYNLRTYNSVVKQKCSTWLFC